MRRKRKRIIILSLLLNYSVLVLMNVKKNSLSHSTQLNRLKWSSNLIYLCMRIAYALHTFVKHVMSGLVLYVEEISKLWQSHRSAWIRPKSALAKFLSAFRLRFFFWETCLFLVSHDLLQLITICLYFIPWQTSKSRICGLNIQCGSMFR